MQVRYYAAVEAQAQLLPSQRIGAPAVLVDPDHVRSVRILESVVGVQAQFFAFQQGPRDEGPAGRGVAAGTAASQRIEEE